MCAFAGDGEKGGLASGSGGGDDVFVEAVADDKAVGRADAESRGGDGEKPGIGFADADDGALDDRAEAVADAEVAQYGRQVAVEVADKSQRKPVGEATQQRGSPVDVAPGDAVADACDFGGEAVGAVGQKPA